MFEVVLNHISLSGSVVDDALGFVDATPIVTANSVTVRFTVGSSFTRVVCHVTTRPDPIECIVVANFYRTTHFRN